MKIEIEVTCCKDCPYNKEGRDHGAMFHYCSKGNHYLNSKKLHELSQACPFKEETDI